MIRGPKKRLLPLERKLAHVFSEYRVRSFARWVLAVSGGEDSVALLYAVAALKDMYGLQVHVAFVHHGENPLSQKKYRDRAAQYVGKSAKALGLPFRILRVETDSCSEASYREARYKALDQFAKEVSALGVITAHHSDDLLETRLMRLIRGVGGQGILAMKIWSPEPLIRFRPFLELSRAEIKSYLKLVGKRGLKDPSNSSDAYFRNWIRNTWLPMLEDYKRGSQKSLSRSLEVLSENAEDDHSLSRHLQGSGGLKLKRAIMDLSPGDQRKLLAQFLRAHKVSQYRRSQIEEVRKRLSTPKKEFNFFVAGVHWQVDTEHIELMLSRVGTIVNPSAKN